MTEKRIPSAVAKGPQPLPATQLCRPGRGRLLALASGVLYFLAFPGMDIWPLAFVAWVPWLFAAEGKSTRECTLLGWLSGFAMTFLGFYWVFGLLKTFSGFPTPICVLLMALLSAYQAGRIALMGFLYGRMRTRRWPRAVAMPLAFAVSEFGFPLVFPWYFGATLYSQPLLIQVADLGNPIVVGLVLCAFNLGLFRLLVALRLKEHLPYRALALFALPLPLTLLYGAYRLRQVDQATAQAAKGRVGIVQANMGLLEKRRDRHEGLRRHLALSRRLLAEGPLDLLVWSETSVAGGVYEDQAELVYGRLFTRDLGVPTLFGALLMRDVSDARQYTLFNSTLMSDSSGNIVGRYDKHKLLAFGEYLPLGDVFPKLYEWSPNTGKFTPGTSLAPLKLGSRHISAHVCYEDVLPSFINEMFQEGPGDLIVNLTNDAWYGDTTQPWIHLALSQFRAIEHRRFLVRSTNSGVSAFVDAAGRVLTHTGTFEQAAVAREVAYIEGFTTPYQTYGNAPWWLCTALGGFASIRRRRPKPPHAAA